MPGLWDKARRRLKAWGHEDGKEENSVTPKAWGMFWVGFQQQFETEEACREYLLRKRWPKVFVCPKSCTLHLRINSVFWQPTI